MALIIPKSSTGLALSCLRGATYFLRHAQSHPISKGNTPAKPKPYSAWRYQEPLARKRGSIFDIESKSEIKWTKYQENRQELDAWMVHKCAPWNRWHLASTHLSRWTEKVGLSEKEGGLPGFCPICHLFLGPAMVRFWMMWTRMRAIKDSP